MRTLDSPWLHHLRYRTLMYWTKYRQRFTLIPPFFCSFNGISQFFRECYICHYQRLEISSDSVSIKPIFSFKCYKLCRTRFERNKGNGYAYVRDYWKGEIMTVKWYNNLWAIKGRLGGEYIYIFSLCDM